MLVLERHVGLHNNNSVPFISISTSFLFLCCNCGYNTSFYVNSERFLVDIIVLSPFQRIKVSFLYHLYCLMQELYYFMLRISICISVQFTDNYIDFYQLLICQHDSYSFRFWGYAFVYLPMYLFVIFFPLLFSSLFLVFL